MYENFLCVLKALKQRWVFNLQVFILLVEGDHLDLLLGVDEGDHSAARAQDQLGLVLEQHLDDFVGVPQQDGLLCALPFLDVGDCFEIPFFSHWGGFLVEIEDQGLELVVAIKIALKMLQEDDLLVDRLRVIKQVVVVDFIPRGICLGAFNVLEMEEVLVGNDLRVVVKENSIASVGEFIPESILR